MAIKSIRLKPQLYGLNGNFSKFVPHMKFRNFVKFLEKVFLKYVLILSESNSDTWEKFSLFELDLSSFT